METNMGLIDRVIRVSLALIVVILIATGVISGILAVVLGIFAAIFILTSVIGFCPLYKPFGIRTCR